MRTMYSPLFQAAGFQLAVVVLFATAPFIIATTPPSQPRLQLGDPVVQRRHTGLPTGWVEIGCYSTSLDRPTLTAMSYSDPNEMTVGNCIVFCNTHEKALAGVENGKECHCGNVMTIGAANDSESNCLTPCGGDPDQYCGGDSNFMNIYSNGAPLQPFPTIAQNPQHWFTLGCFLDSNGARTLSTLLLDFSGYTNSAEACILACHAAGFTIAGMEFADQCWCDTSIRHGGKPVDSSACQLPCPGNSFQICGGAHSIVVFSAYPIHLSP